MSSDNVVSSIVEGAVKGALSWTKEEIIRLAAKFKSGKTVLARDLANIDVAREQKQTTEYQLFCDHVKDKQLQVLFHTGLSLQKISRTDPKWTHIRDVVFKTYGVEGLHIAQFAQNGLFSKYYGFLMGRGLTPKQCSEEILAFFNDIESTVCFVQNEAVVAQVARSILTKLDSHSPHVFVISGSASAMVKCR